MDLGDEIIYTGQGGRDLNTGSQIKHQQLNRGNLALARSKLNGRPVRVIRGAYSSSPYAPETGYRYDGLYRVDDYWQDQGKSGFYVWRYRLLKINDEVYPSDIIHEQESGYQAADRIAVTTVRVIRDTAMAQSVKKLYEYRCQVCGTRLEGSAGPYAESAHIRPLGRPHHGSDTPDNILCLCPNHHVLFDYGGFTIADDFSLVGIEGNLNTHPKHKINLKNIRYHQEHYFPIQEET